VISLRKISFRNLKFRSYCEMGQGKTQIAE
jgi:hypothetical protein